MVSLRLNDHNFNINQKTREFFFECEVGESSSLTTEEIKAEAVELLNSVLKSYEWVIDGPLSVEIQLNLFDNNASVRVKGTVYED